MSSDRTTEILSYLRAISRDICTFRAEVNTRFDQLEARVQGLESEMRGLRDGMRSFSKQLKRYCARVLDFRATRPSWRSV
ncbi:MAG TPA: hypothetical protein VF525_10755 [Pyrinomonadaceae bacterium]|jgi:hypothetical protein